MSRALTMRMPARPVPATEVAFGAPRPIHDPLTLPMALRRLRRIRTPGTVVTVDIDATVEATADAGGRLMTVLTRPPKRALDLALVADAAPSMDIWAGTLDELERLLAQTGAFRSVSRWTLRLSGDAVQLESRDGRAQPPRRLIDPTGRRLVLLATDGRDEAWYSAAPWDTLGAWCAVMPTALLQMLPQHYWATTAVGDPYLTTTALRPAAPNSQYVRRLAWWADDPGGVPLPVVTLSPHAMETWAQVVAGGTAWAAGITAVPPTPESAPSGDGGADPLMLVNDFRSRASRGAQRLARILASTETLSMPLIEVLQDRLAPETGVLERAEVLASGMLTQNRTADGQALFRYRPGIPEILRRGATTFEEWDTYTAVSEYLEDRHHHLGGPLHALVADPTGTAEHDAAEAPFAALHKNLAVRLGLRDPAVNRRASSATSGPSDGKDPASSEAEDFLYDEAGNLLLDEAGDIRTSQASGDVHSHGSAETGRIARAIIQKADLGSLTLLAEGAFGEVYRVPEYRLPGDPMELAYKEFTQEQAVRAKSAAAAVAYRAGLSPAEQADLDSRAVWPRMLVEEPRDTVKGLLMPLIPAEFFCRLADPLTGVLVDRPLEMTWLASSAGQRAAAQLALREVNKLDRLILLGQLVYAIGRLHKHGWVFGDLALRNAVFALDPPRVLLLDCDGAAPLSDPSRRQATTPYWDPPECPPRGPQRLQDDRTDVYKLGLAILRCMAPGKGAATAMSPDRLAANWTRKVPVW